jgi:IS30 family transposase
MKQHQKFTAQERDLLALWLSRNVSKSACARRLHRPRRSILREVKRNGCWLVNHNGKREFVYVAITAQARANKRQLNSAYNKQPLKNPDVYRYVTRHLRGGWSPEQICGRLREGKHKGDPHWQVSHETIYAWIYHQPKDETGLYWYEYLRRKQRKRRKQTGKKVHCSQIPDMVSISKRPAKVNQRREFGHWEGDSIEGKRTGSGAGLHTEVERMSRRLKAVKVEKITSEETVKAWDKIFGTEPARAVKSTTLDRGKETHLHTELRVRFGMKTYHAHPYSSFERGTNEHGNWHVRYYFPKGTDFATVSSEELQAVVAEINNRPRKIHGFKTANEVYYQLLKKAQV